MTETHEPATAHREATAWVVRVGDPDFDEWHLFEQWLAASPDHAEAYHAAATAEAEMVAIIAAAPRSGDPVISNRNPAGRRFGWAGAALAASLAGAVVFRSLAPSPVPVIYETAPGVRQFVQLPDGSSMLLNGGTKLTAVRGDPRSLKLVRGEAIFTVRHDEANPFRITVGAASLVDVGTRFNVVYDAGATRVSVAEGAVDWRLGSNAVRVRAGRQMRASDRSSNVEIGDVDPGTIGGWSQGQLAYDGVALSEVAEDLARTLGTTITVSPSVAAKKVRSVIRLDGGAGTVVPRLAALVGARARWDGQRWRLTG